MSPLASSVLLRSFMDGKPMEAQIAQKIAELGLPKGSFVVVAGSMLVALGLLKWDGDIDIDVSPETFWAV